MIRPRNVLVSLFMLLALTTSAKAADKEKPYLRTPPPILPNGQSPVVLWEKREKLLRAVSLPSISVFIGYGVSRRGDFESQAEVIPEPNRIAEINKELKGDATDTEHYSRLGDLYARSGQPDKAKEARLKAAELFRKQLEQHSDDAAIQLRLADTLDDLKRWEEAENMVRRVVKDHPSDWHAWLLLGQMLDLKSSRAITGYDSLRSTGPEALMQSMRELHPTPEKITASQQYRREAVACFDRAVRLAPGESEVYRRRGASRYHYGFLDCGLRLYKGEKADFYACMFAREALPDLRRAVELNRQEYNGIGFVALMETLAEVYDRQQLEPSAGQAKKPVDGLSQATRKRVLEYMAWLEKGSEALDKSKAAKAAEVLGGLQLYLLADYSAAEKSARRSMALNPKREAPWDLLNACLAGAEKYKKLTAACRERLEHKDSSRNRLLLAKGYEYLDQLDKAEEVVRAGLQHEPNDFMLRLALVDLLLLRREPESLREAGELLSKLSKDDHSNGGSENRWVNYAFTSGIFCGLIGETEKAQNWLHAVQKRQPDLPKVEDALKALEE